MNGLVRTLIAASILSTFGLAVAVRNVDARPSDGMSYTATKHHKRHAKKHHKNHHNVARAGRHQYQDDRREAEGPNDRDSSHEDAK